MKKCPRCGLKYPDDNDRCYVDKSVLEPMQDERIGKVLKGRYQIENVLGEGGMAVVYRARSTLVDRAVAVKVMNPHLVRDHALVERFRREAKNAAAVAHPNIIDIFDYGETEDGTPFLVMELLDGEPLDKMIARGPMPPPNVASLGLQVARGLARAHDFSVLHRDLKPENIFVVRDARGQLSIPKLLDFGIARSMHDQRLTNAGEIFGTPQYMAPERLTSIDAGASADLYALGVILFEMVTGRLPFVSDDIPGFFIKHLQEPPPAPSSLVPSIPRRLEGLILQLLAKRPEERPVDAHAVVKELTALAPAEPIDAPAADGRASRPPQAAPTLPPATLERWAHRAAVFDQMLARAFPPGRAPPELAQSLAEMRTILSRLLELRSGDLKEQRKLEAMEASANEARERLGHAVHVIAQDLSAAREAARHAQRDVQPYFDGDAAAVEAYRRAHARWSSVGGAAPIASPTPAIVQAARELAETLDRWLLASGTAAKAKQWVDAKQREVDDVAFQADALRAQLERLETSYENDRRGLEELLGSHHQQIAALETRLTELAGLLATPLQQRADLRDLLTTLETEPR
ncbi:MAG: protein kinase [Sandaracinaceae bacterium]|nr:protein kinase [Sandaracinaceae bacterium]